MRPFAHHGSRPESRRSSGASLSWPAMPSTVRTRIVQALLVASFALGCGASEPPSIGAVSARGPATSTLEGEELSGSYAVRGVTVQAVSGRQREIDGTLQLRIDGDRYDVSFELDTTAPDLEGNVRVQVRGEGRGFVVGDLLTGTAEEWMTLEPPPGGLEAIDLKAELPARAGRKLVSTSRGSFDEDGAFEIVIENYPAPGERYEPSMTVLTGYRAPGAGSAD